MDDDQKSTTSGESFTVVEESFDVVDDIADALGVDNTEDGENIGVTGPNIEGFIVESGNSLMITSQYSQVVFRDVSESYNNCDPILCQYTLTNGLQSNIGDRVALYRIPFLQPHEFITYSWAQEPAKEEETELQVTFLPETLPKEEDFYQFQYLQGDSIVAGASVPFQIRKAVQAPEVPEKKLESFITLEKENISMLHAVNKAKDLEGDMAALVNEKVLLEQTLAKERETFNKIETVLEMTTTKLKQTETMLHAKDSEIQSLREELDKTVKNCDLEAAVREKENLSVMLEKEIVARELLLQQKADLVEKLEDQSNMLNAALKSKALAVEELRTQVIQQDQLRKELSDAREEAAFSEAELVKMKELVENQTDDEKSAGDTNVDSASVKSNNSNREAVSMVLSSLGAKLEAKEKEVEDKVKEINLLKMVEKENDKMIANVNTENSLLISERNQLNEKVSTLENQNDELKKRLELGKKHYEALAIEKKQLERKPISEEVEQLRAQIVSLETRNKQLETDMANFERMSLAQSSVAGSSSSIGRVWGEIGISDTESCASNMNSLKINDAIKASVTHDSSICSSVAVGGAKPKTSASGEGTRARPSLFHPLNTSSLKLTEGKRAEAADSTLTASPAPTVVSTSVSSQSSSLSGTSISSLSPSITSTPNPSPSLFQPLNVKNKPESKAEKEGSSSLPHPLEPENCDPTVLPPEIRPRQPAPYRISQSQPDIETEGGAVSDSTLEPETKRNTITEAEEIPHVDEPPPGAAASQPQAPLEDNCPVCTISLPVGKVLEKHVEQHFLNTLECPVCDKAFNKDNQKEYEDHVQDHFKDEDDIQHLRDCGWDLEVF